ncbi:PREDICTED: myosin phosphatase Rho-interacting protein-like isoform X2 [Branchiostoma belcheri]|uniref:Myosin phosphatase Rho-interacting protein-like isoform X2 n=1 Tax=Branchiostoma belcheri TaxID=7741 RepID=A0A6P4ZZZ8_BRABE|nr:PREDICTED: myosin phosphatase Rho-interacting protein-like isoform X2 [Branchiostoma belcheri]
MSRKGEPCNKFAANIFNKAKCQNCFRPREEHLLNDSDMSQAKVTACGWMYRAPDLIDFTNPAQRSRKWQRRWFVLFEHGGLVFSLDENPSTIPQGTINMNQCTEVYDGQGRTGKENCLAIVTPDSVDYVSTDNKFDIDRCGLFFCLLCFA